MSARFSLSDLPLKHQLEVTRQLERGRPVGIAMAGKLAAESAQAKPMLRQKSGQKLNKTEAAYLSHLRGVLPPESFVEPHALTLLLANGLRYTPDFIVSDSSGLWAYEVKGHMRDDAAAKLKMAASKFTFIKFILVWRNGASWGQQRIHS